MPSENVLDVDADHIALLENQAFVDVREFEKVTYMLRKNLNVLSNTTLSDEMYIQIRGAVNLWRGSGFLSGTTIVESENIQRWASEKTDSCEVWHQMMLEWLVDHCIARGNLSEALQWLSIVLLHDRLNSEKNYLMLNCLRDLGAWAELGHYCDVLEKIYQEDGISTLPELLRDAIDRSRDAIKKSTKKSKSVWELQDLRLVHFVDFERRMDHLRFCLNRGGMIIIKGEAGLGKSRLMREFYDSLEVVPRFVFYMSQPNDQIIPYRMIVGALRPIVANEEWNQLDPVYAKVLYPLFPELAKIRKDIDDQILPMAQNLSYLIPEAFLAVFNILSNQRKVVFFFDDAQWSDTESLNILAFVHERGDQDEMDSFFIAAQSEVNNYALDKLILLSSKLKNVEVMNLSALNSDEVNEFAYSLMNEKISAEVNAWLLVESGGNPELLIAMITTIRGMKKTLQECLDADDYPIDGALEEIILRKFTYLTDVQREAIKTASVLGQQFSSEMLESVTGMLPKELDSILKILVNCRVLQIAKINENSLGYEFVHGAVRRVLERSLQPQEKRIFHLQAIKTFKNQEAVTYDNQVQAAKHCEAVDQFDEAFRFWNTAGNIARKNFNLEKVNLAYGNALKLIPQMGDRCSGLMIYTMVRAWSDFDMDMGDLATSVQIYDWTVRFGQERKDERLVGFAETGNALFEVMIGNDQTGRDLLQRAINRLNLAHELEELARTHSVRGSILTMWGEFVEALEDFEQTQSIAAENPSIEIDGTLLFKTPYHVLCLSILGRTKEALDLANQMLKMAKVWKQSSFEVIISMAQSVALFSDRNPNASIDALESGDASSRGFGDEWFGLLFILMKCKVYLEKGEFNICWELLDKFIKVSEGNAKQKTGLEYAYYLKAEIYRRLGDHETAEIYYEKGLAHCSNHFFRLHHEFGKFLNDYRLKEGKVNKADLEKIIDEIGERKYVFFENYVRTVYLLMYVNDFSIEKLEQEISFLEEKINKFKQFEVMPNLLSLKGTVAIRKKEMVLAARKFKEAYQNSLKTKNFLMQLRSLQLLIQFSIDREEKGSYEKAYRRLLKDFKEASINKDLESRVKKFVTKQEFYELL